VLKAVVAGAATRAAQGAVEGAVEAGTKATGLRVEGSQSEEGRRAGSKKR
jgi:hypothetical protein